MLLLICMPVGVDADTAVNVMADSVVLYEIDVSTESPCLAELPCS